MKITPLEIRQKNFEKVFRGYDKDEVQAFLNSLSHEWERLLDEYKEIKIKLEATQNEVEKLRQVESSLFKTLKTAEDTGANMIEQANKAAELKMREAKMESEQTIMEANSRATSIIENAQKTSQQMLADMMDAIKSLENDYHRIESLRDSMLLELKNISADTMEKVEKFRQQKTRFNFEDHLQKAKDITRQASEQIDEEPESASRHEPEQPEPPQPEPEKKEAQPVNLDPAQTSSHSQPDRQSDQSKRSFFDEID